jgi:hypothetical protein
MAVSVHHSQSCPLLSDRFFFPIESEEVLLGKHPGNGGHSNVEKMDVRFSSDSRVLEKN